MNTQGTTGKSWWPGWRGRVILIALLATAGFYLVTEHTAHVLGGAPYVLLGVFVLLHVFMHTGHGGHGGHTEPGEFAHPASDAGHEQHHGGHTNWREP